MATELLPEFLLTPSGCLADLALEFWWSEENVVEARAFGVLEGLLPDAVASIAVHRRGRCRCHHDCDGAHTP
jgi:hypothetical protein